LSLNSSRFAQGPRPGDKAPPSEKKFAPLAKLGHLAFKIVIKKGKILKIKPEMALGPHLFVKVPQPGDSK